MWVDSRRPFRTPLIVLLMSGAAGCASLRSYPVCLYDTELAAATSADAAWPDLRMRLGQVLEVGGAEKTSVVVNSRMAVAKTTQGQDRKITRVWPRLACFGRSGGTETDAALRICTAYVQEFLAKDRARRPTPASVACRTVGG